MKYVLIGIILFFSLINPIHAAFYEDIRSGTVKNISDDFLYLNNQKITLSAEVLTYIKEGDLITYGSPEPIVLVYENNKIRYGYGNLFYSSNKLELINGVSLEIIKTEKLIDKTNSGMFYVKTYFNISDGEETIEYLLNPGEYTHVFNLTIGVHRAEKSDGFYDGPQHWYVYEVRTDNSQIIELEYVEPKLDIYKINEFKSVNPNTFFRSTIYLLGVIFIIIYFIAKRIKKK
ncbi:hypothetical protein GQ473_03515 [archaeon]|nr:hypothetical protein [archaeon]